MACEISDEEFEENLEPVYEAWEGGLDTVDIAQLCKLSEAKVHWILQCYLEGKFCQMEEARFELEQWPAFKPEAYVDVGEALGPPPCLLCR